MKMNKTVLLSCLLTVLAIVMLTVFAFLLSNGFTSIWKSEIVSQILKETQVIRFADGQAYIAYCITRYLGFLLKNMAIVIGTAIALLLGYVGIYRLGKSRKAQ